MQPIAGGILEHSAICCIRKQAVLITVADGCVHMPYMKARNIYFLMLISSSAGLISLVAYLRPAGWCWIGLGSNPAGVEFSGGAGSEQTQPAAR